MTPELEALGRRAVACKGWRWMCGMWTDHGLLLDEPSASGRALLSVLGEHPTAWDIRVVLPDLQAPPTLGCLLALVREALEDSLIAVAADPDIGSPVWMAFGEALPGVPVAVGTTEAEALVAALEAAQIAT